MRGKRFTDNGLPDMIPKCVCGSFLDRISAGGTFITVTRSCKDCGLRFRLKVSANPVTKRHDLTSIEAIE